MPSGNELKASADVFAAGNRRTASDSVISSSPSERLLDTDSPGPSGPPGSASGGD